MPASVRDYRIMQECKVGTEPCFVIRAKDNFALDVLDFYLDSIVGEVTTEFIEAIEDKINEFKTWRGENPEFCHTPDLKPGEPLTAE